MADPISSLDTIGNHLEISYPMPLTHHFKEILAYVQRDLEHDFSGEREIKGFETYSWLYDQLRILQASRVERIEAGGNRKSLPKGSELDGLDHRLDNFPMLELSKETLPKPISSTSNHLGNIFHHLLYTIHEFEKERLSDKLQRERRLLTADHQGVTLYSQLMLPDHNQNDNISFVSNLGKMLLAPDEWQTLSFEISSPDRLSQESIVFRPLNTVGLIRIAAINLIDIPTKETVWSASENTGFKEFEIDHGMPSG